MCSDCFSYFRILFSFADMSDQVSLFEIKELIAALMWKNEQLNFHIHEPESSAVAAIDPDHEFEELGVRFEDVEIGDFVQEW